jgi:hypothetical protein
MHMNLDHSVQSTAMQSFSGFSCSRVSAWSNLLKLCLQKSLRISLRLAPRSTVGVHASEHALLADIDVGRLPVAAVAISLTIADIAEVSETFRASHVVAANRTLHPGLTHRTRLAINAPGQARQLALRLLRPPRHLRGPAAKMRDDVSSIIRVHLVRALHAVCLQAGATAAEGGLVRSFEASERANVHAHCAVAVQAGLDGSFALLSLHVVEHLVLLEGLLSAEQSCREHARVERCTAYLATAAVGRLQHHVHAVLEAGEAVVILSNTVL